jgi:hypothetical protein
MYISLSASLRDHETHVAGCLMFESALSYRYRLSTCGCLGVAEFRFQLSKDSQVLASVTSGGRSLCTPLELYTDLIDGPSAVIIA